MKRVRYSTKAKKELKRVLKDPSKTKALFAVLRDLSLGKTLPLSFRVHTLTGQYKGCLECHIENDFLLIWIDEECIRVVRMGSHSELFK